MKKQGAFLLLVGACLFLALLIGFFIGRNAARPTIEIERLTETKAQLASQTTTAPAETEAAYPVNINTATAEQLQTLPGIGPALAQRIVDYRQTNGLFTSLSELTMVEGIGIAKLEAILDYITLGGEE